MSNLAQSTRHAFRNIVPGLSIAIIVAIAALFLSSHYGASAMLFALLLGMALNFLSKESKTAPGIQFAASIVLRIGVALLGLRIVFADIAALGFSVAAIVVCAVVATIVFGAWCARFAREDTAFGVLTGGAVAICGASAALAIAAALPKHENADRNTSFTIIGVTALSTLAMIVYPIVSRALGLSEHEAGIFIGATIHDVAQVVGAGYTISKDAGDTATIVKLLRVAMLLPVIFVVTMLYRASASAGSDNVVQTKRPPLLPWFVALFAALVVLNSLVPLPAAMLSVANDTSRFFLVTAIAALGMKTQLGELRELGLRPILLMVGQTLFLALLVFFALKLIVR
jgi:uncharacterized integral membrane protein (TIGR00698 family)